MTLIIFLKSKENIIMLFILLVSTLLISLFLLSPLNITSGNWNSTQTHFSSVGVEALAGVLAIVISVTLMAVQFSSQEYSQKIMGSYIRSFFFWSLIVIYILTIIFNILILNRIPQNITNNTINTKMVDLSIMLTILCFVLLIPYFLFTVMQLRPEHIIKRILMSVDKKFAKSNQGKDLEDLDSDPVLPVIDIIEKAMKSYDRSTIRLGLDKMYERYDLITKENDQFISGYFKKHFLKLSESAMLNSNIYTIKRIVDNFVKMARQHNAKEKTYATDHATDAFYQIAVNALEHNLTEVVIYTVDKFVKVVTGFKKSEKDMIIAYEDIAPRLSGLGQIISKQNELEVATMKVLEGLRKLEDIFGLNMVGSSAIENSQTNAAMKAVEMLVDLSKDLSKKTELEEDMKMAINTANDLILEATDNKQKVELASTLLGEYMGKELSKGKTNIKELENESYCKFKVLEEGFNKVILEMKSCCIKTIKKFDDEKIQSYCQKTSATNEQGYEELPVCTITYSYLTSAIKQIKSYMFSWENVQGNDEGRLIRFFVDELGINSAKNAEIYKSNDDEIINVGMDDYTAKIMMDNNKKKAKLEISEDRIYDLIVENENGKLNIYMQTNIKLNKPIEWNENGCPRLTFILEYPPFVELKQSALSVPRNSQFL
jgi:phosphoribosylcarboxyaminoimidazole (NCAIR) mutase